MRGHLPQGGHLLQRVAVRNPPTACPPFGWLRSAQLRVEGRAAECSGMLAKGLGRMAGALDG